jgi:hypothetical protein
MTRRRVLILAAVAAGLSAAGIAWQFRRMSFNGCPVCDGPQ